MAWFIYTVIGGIGILIWSLVKSVNFSATINSILGFRMPLWIIVSIIAVWAIYKLIRKGPRAVVKDTKYINSGPKISPTSPLNSTVELDQKLIFDSNINSDTSWKGYGQQIWDATTKSLIGEKAIGDYHFKEHILTIARDNVAGRYIITLNEYFYHKEKTSFIPKNLYGNNPRSFRVIFNARAVKGSHRIFVVFRRKENHSWINHVVFDTVATQWERQLASLTIPCDEGFVLELHTYSHEAPSRFQIKDFLVEEI
jgi:hypothetical protein